jgi:hypothetical protein
MGDSSLEDRERGEPEGEREMQVRELATRDVAVVNAEKKTKRRREDWIINRKILLVDEFFFGKSISS